MPITTSFNLTPASRGEDPHGELSSQKDVNKLFFPGIAEEFTFDLDNLIFKRSICDNENTQIRQYEHHTTRRNLVIKFIPINYSVYADQENEKAVKRLLSEINSHKELQSESNIVTFYGFGLSQGRLMIAMELLDMSLSKFYKDCYTRCLDFPEWLVGKVAVAILNALIACKKHRIMHRDIKPDNILLNYCGQIKLCDFGISRKVNDASMASTNIGTNLYLPPERLLNPKEKYDVRSEVWSLGVTLAEIARGIHPFLEPNEKISSDYSFMLSLRIVQTLPNDIIEKCFQSKYSSELKDFVKLCLGKLEDRPFYEKLIQQDFYIKNKEPELERVATVIQRLKKEVLNIVLIGNDWDIVFLNTVAMLFSHPNLLDALKAAWPTCLINEDKLKLVDPNKPTWWDRLPFNKKEYIKWDKIREVRLRAEKDPFYYIYTENFDIHFVPINLKHEEETDEEANRFVAAIAGSMGEFVVPEAFAGEDDHMVELYRNDELKKNLNKLNAVISEFGSVDAIVFVDRDYTKFPFYYMKELELILKNTGVHALKNCFFVCHDDDQVDEKDVSRRLTKFQTKLQEKKVSILIPDHITRFYYVSSKVYYYKSQNEVPNAVKDELNTRWFNTKLTLERFFNKIYFVKLNKIQ